jgi:hypothetical protein
LIAIVHSLAADQKSLTQLANAVTTGRRDRNAGPVCRRQQRFTSGCCKAEP